MFIDRTNEGIVTALYACAQYEGQEELPDDHADILAFRAPKRTIITNAQLKRQLDADGTLTAAKATIAQVDGLAEELWFGAATFLIDDPLLVQLAAAIGYDTDEKLKDFFEAASQII